MARIYNFSAGPAILPEAVLQEAQANLVDYKGAGMSLMEMSHRGKEYDAVHTEAIANLKRLMGLDDDFSILFQTGGASMQFALVPMNLLGPGQTADYINAGAWGKKAIKEAKLIGNVNIAADTSKEKPSRMPKDSELKLTPGASYLHLTTNETIEGTQVKETPRVEAPLVADMSSDILSRPRDFAKYGLIYAGAQKNMGPAGVTLVAIRKDLLDRSSETIPAIMRYKTHAAEGSLYNTPPTFPIYIVMLVTRWIDAQGGLAAIAKANAEKAALLYAAIDNSGGFYRGTAAKEDRSDMNVTYRLPSEELEEKFIKEAASHALKGLKGHRSVGGVRASIYNAFPRAGVETLVSFMRDFQAKNG
ncbi:MAG: 3-phosphoserine/phosphohydroxythreonine transaminase [Kiritimatiellae bacterium]|nr:3-phosphoserine/phosphohydroxythreonine transaminase [Kiritimatiellia bacterium]MCO5060982.1 3-phosphoserine/phosphohydroxythreonine transaminase [Kiritimatiellia bacterium]MCO6401825.1 3-phosphoserine/phosphohydroxythreonine transaminase [Verrucomicrobiota bacterium]